MLGQASPTRDTPQPPPLAETASGKIRRVGVEIEFANLPAPMAVALLQRLYDGRIERQDEHRYALRDSEFGTFSVELDARIAHPEEAPKEAGGKHFVSKARGALGHAIAVVVPTEIVCPPIPWDQLGRLDALIDMLRENGAEGTDAGPFYGFGVHLNPEIAASDTEYVRRHLMAFAVLEPTLRKQIGIDAMRRILPFVDPFPAAYLKCLLAPNYRPDLKALIRDHIRANQTRNRGLDMMPLWRHLDRDTLLAELRDPSLVKARPTFHYRLPDTRLSDPDWNVAREWNRWLQVERLAADPDRLEEARDRQFTRLSRGLAKTWLHEFKAWMRP